MGDGTCEGLLLWTAFLSADWMMGDLDPAFPTRVQGEGEGLDSTLCLQRGPQSTGVGVERMITIWGVGPQ
jgi:hypothetical protein